jgi:TRAP-type transport system periplasmic protein
MRVYAVALCLLAVGAWFLGGCGPKPDANAGKELKFAYVMAPAGAAHEAAGKFAQLVSEKTNGSLTVKLYPSAQLGTDRELAEGLTFGSVDLILSGMGSVAAYIPEYEALEAPFAFRDYDHLAQVVHGPIGYEVGEALLKAKGIRVLSWWFRGPRYLTANKAIRTPADLTGMKLRVPKLPTYIEAWKLLGANTTPITYKEMFMALQQGTVEGQEDPLEVIESSSLYEVQSHVMETRHLLGTFMLMASDAMLQKLSPEQRAAIEEAAVEAAAFELDLMQKYDTEYRAKLEERGMTFVEVDVEAFRKPVVESLPAMFKDRWAPDLFERIQSTR